MKVLLTGGAGFIGSHTAVALLERGDTVIVIDEVNDYYDTSIKEENLSILRKYGEDKCRIHIRDICDKEYMEELYVKEKPDMICHLAARAGVRYSIENPLEYTHSNVEATTVLLQLAAKHGTKNFVFASSSSVYGGECPVPFEETQAVEKPVSPYAATKRACELLAWTYHHLYKFPIAGLRFFTVYGPRGRPDMAPFIFINNIMKGIPIKQFGDGTSYRDYTFISDIVSGVLGSLDYPNGYQVYNLGRGDPINLKDFIALIEETVGKKAEINQLPMQPGDVPRTYANVEKAKSMLKYTPKVSTQEGIAKTVEWFRTRQESK